MLSVPATTTFEQLHVGIQIAFQWDDDHAYRFMVQNCSEWTKKTSKVHKSFLWITQLPPNPRYALNTPEVFAREVTLTDILEHTSYHGKVIEYLCEFRVNLSQVLIVKGRT
jgi:hypothetical protein